MTRAVHSQAAGVLWDRFPQTLSRAGPWFGQVAADGRYLSAAPGLNLILPLAALAAGVIAGALNSGRQPIYTDHPALLGVLLVLGIASGLAGLIAVCGFVIADGALWTKLDVIAAHPAYLAALVVSWAFLFLLVVVFPEAARGLSRLPPALGAARGLLAAMVAAALSALWAQMAMLSLRPVFIWQGSDVNPSVAAFSARTWSAFGLDAHPLVWVAIGAGLARWAGEALIPRAWPPAALATQPSAPARPAPWAVAALLRAGALALAVAGAFVNPVGLAIFWAAAAGLVMIRALASSRPAIARWDRWMRAVPPLGRLAVSFAIALTVSLLLGRLLRESFGWRTMTAAPAAILVAFAGTLPLWPQVAPGAPAPRPPFALQRAGRLFRAAAPLSVFMTASLAATAAWAHHCSIHATGCECLPDNSAFAALAAAGATFGALMLDLGRAGLDPGPAGAAAAGFGAPSPAWGEQPMDGAVATFERMQQLETELDASGRTLDGYAETQRGYAEQLEALRARMRDLYGESGFGAAEERFREWFARQGPILPETEIKGGHIRFKPDLLDAHQRLMESYHEGLQLLLEESTLPDKQGLVSSFQHLQEHSGQLGELMQREHKRHQALQQELDGLRGGLDTHRPAGRTGAGAGFGDPPVSSTQ